MTTTSVGNRGEAEAAGHLRKLGYRIVETNFRAAGGEIDIVAEHRGALVFVEVKARGNASFGGPFEAVDLFKQRRLIKAARAYMALRNAGDRPVRFDVVAVRLDRTPHLVEVMEDAFFAEE